MTAQVVIAARGGPGAKSRLAGVLGEADRATLAQVMLADMLDAAVQAQTAAALWVVTPTDALADLAIRRGARVIRQTEPTGLNGAFDRARRFLAERAPYNPVAMLVGDLPLLTAGDLDAAICLVRSHRVVLAPALADGGTGAVVLQAGARFTFAFGRDSFVRHQAAARRFAHPTAVVHADSLGRDVDRPDDLRAVLARGPATHTAGFLREAWREPTAP